MNAKRKVLQKSIVYIAGILSNVSSIEELTLSIYKGVNNIECSLMCIQSGDVINEKVLNDNFGVRNKELEKKTGVRISFKVVSSKELSEKVDKFNVMTLKEFVNSEVIIDRDGRLIALQDKLGRTSRSDLGEYFNQIDFDTAVRTMTM